MGIDLDLLTSHPGQSFVCPVCFDALGLDVTDIGCSNQHFFCNECVKGVTSCPLCRESVRVATFKSAPFARRHVASLERKCDRHDIGCGWTGRIDQYMNHDAECDYPLVSCPNKNTPFGFGGCPIRLPKRAIADHLEKDCQSHSCRHAATAGCDFHGTRDAVHMHQVRYCDYMQETVRILLERSNELDLLLGNSKGKGKDLQNTDTSNEDYSRRHSCASTTANQADTFIPTPSSKKKGRGTKAHTSSRTNESGASNPSGSLPGTSPQTSLGGPGPTQSARSSMATSRLSAFERLCGHSRCDTRAQRCCWCINGYEIIRISDSETSMLGRRWSTYCSLCKEKGPMINLPLFELPR